MTEVAPADRANILRSKRAEQSAIVVSRKRKFRELISLAATGDDDIPNRDFSDPDTTPYTLAETKLFHALGGKEIFQGRKLNELNIPARQQIDPDALRRFLSSSDHVAAQNAPLNGKEETRPNDSNSSESPLHFSGHGADGVRASSPKGVAPTPIPSPKPTFASQALDLPTDRLGNTGQNCMENGPTKASGGDMRRSDDGLAVGVTPRLETVECTGMTAKQPPDATGSTASLSMDVTKIRDTKGAAQLEPVPDAMDVDDSPGAPTQVNTQNGQVPGHDPTRFQETASSPGSTAHSATTPAVHDASTDTSPESGEAQYEEKDEGMDDVIHEPRAAGYGARPLKEVDGFGQQPESSTDSVGSMVDGVEAQVLQESAAAAQLLQKPGTTESGELKDSSDAAKIAAAPTNACDENSGMKSTEMKSVSDAAPIDTSTSETGTSNMPNVEREVPDSQDSPETAVATQSSAASASATVHRGSMDPRDIPAEPSRAHNAITPTSEGPPSALNSPSTERPNTRIATGLLLQKSVSEILGDVPKTLPTPSEPTHPHDYDGGDDEESVAAARFKARSSRAKDRRRSVPTVVFGKPLKPTRKPEELSQVVKTQRPGQIPSDDYFTPLFIEGFTKQTPWMKPLEKLLNTAHKTVSTPDQYLSLADHQACKILRRVYHLQQHNKWSLRQPMRCPEPTRPPSHWDVLLREMKWMRTDFREERKWKLATARNLAYACAEWVWASPEERKELQLNVVIPSSPATPREYTGSAEAMDGVEEAVPDLVFSDSPMEHEEDAVSTPMTTMAPTAIFGLQDDEVVFGLQRSQAADQLLEELPMYGAPLAVPKADLTGPEFDPDIHWKRPAVPLSKYVEGEMVLATKRHPRIASRYQYPVEDESEDDGQVVFGDNSAKGCDLPRSDVNVALFDPEMQMVRDRLHASHQFRPPADLHMPMPPQSFYECRTASQWTLAEDIELKDAVKEYSYNWFLISSIISAKTMFPSGAERRTPWECFERWINLEGLPQDMTKTPYFKAYQNRIDAAQRIIHQHNQAAAQQQANSNGAVTPVPRRRGTLTMRVERRRNQKHLALIDSFRKLAKKRETTAQKAQQAASMAAMRKVNEVPRQQGPTKTPRDYSLMRYERDQQLTERMAQYAQRQQEALQKRQQQQQQARQAHASQNPNPAGAAALPPSNAQVAAANALAGQTRIGVPNSASANGQARPPNARVQLPNPTQIAAAHAQMAAGSMANLSVNGIPQAQLQAAMQAQAQQHAQAQLAAQAAQAMQAQSHAQVPAQHRMAMGNPQPDLNLVLQARRIQDQQRAAVQLQQQQQQQVAQQQHSGPQVPHLPQGGNGGQVSPPGMRNMMNGINHQNFMSNAQAMMASYNAANAASLGAAGANINMGGMNAGSPRGHAIPTQNLPAVAQRLRELENHYRVKHPSLPQDSIRQLATEHLGRLIVQSQQHAMNAAAGGVAQQAAVNGITASSSPHQYAQLLRAQQQQQQAQQQAQQAPMQGGQHQAHPQQHAQSHAQQQPPQQQHRRQSSGSATPVPGK